jgi:two-component system NarL family response regulator
LKILIVEDNALLRENLRLLLSGEPDIEVVAAFESAEEALGELRNLLPDILLADLDLPGMNGIELIRRAKRGFPDLDTLVFTISEDRDTVFAAIKAGASGYLLKGSSPRELVEALVSLRQGGAPMSPKIARKVIREFQDAAQEEDFILSHRECEIVKSIEQGLSYKEIAERFCISPHTVHSHIKNIYDKLQAKDRQTALIKARRKGII